MAAEQQKLAGSWALKQLNRLLLQTSFKKNPTVKLQTAILPKLTRRHSERRVVRARVVILRLIIGHPCDERVWVGCLIGVAVEWVTVVARVYHLDM